VVIVSQTNDVVREKIRQQRSSERRGRESGVVAGETSSANGSDRKIAADSKSNYRQVPPSTKSNNKRKHDTPPKTRTKKN